MDQRGSVERLCVFCGKPLGSDRNAEHVLPKWLMRRGGDIRRTVRLGVDRAGRAIELPFVTLTAPAHTSCNSAWSELENRVCVMAEAIVRGDALAAEEIDPLLDWLDKVRVGVWLQRRMRAGNPASITPGFHVNQRVAAADRFAAFYRFPSFAPGASYLATGSPVFTIMPSVFMIRIDDVVIVSGSAPGLLAQYLGLPRLDVRRGGLAVKVRAPAGRVSSWEAIKSLQPLPQPERLVAQAVWPTAVPEAATPLGQTSSPRLGAPRSAPFNVLGRPPRPLGAGESVPVSPVPQATAVTAGALVSRVLQCQSNVLEHQIASFPRARRRFAATVLAMQRELIAQLVAPTRPT